ncbi:Casanova [Linnemannia hyalina]|uniref:Casanova n=1 Tax=Linnemannia hyalina TaxID=64524 RepID=A0A9P7Y3G9_9FUNG|nr:Casanova [Linnemannia hyalina]
MQSTNAQPTQNSTSPQANKSKGPPSPPSALPERIPRPPNSFIIYRREHAIKYPGLVAADLSAKIAHAWRNESPEVLEQYAELAELAKLKHKLQFPDWKFTPAKRGTGKRARKQAAAAQAAMETGGILPAQAGSLRQSDNKRPKHTALKKRTSRSCGISALATPSPSPSASSSPSPPPEDMITPSNRPRRNIQRPERFSPCGHREWPSHSQTKSSSSSDLKSSASKGTVSSSLFFSRHSGRSSRPAKTLKSSASARSVTFTLPSESHEGFSHTSVDFDDFDFSDDFLSSGEDEDEDEEEYHDDNDFADSDYDENRTTLCLTDADQESFSQSDCVNSPGRPRSRSPSFQSDEHLFYESTFPFPHTMENFEPECLPRSDQQWPTATLVGSFGTIPTEPHIQPNPMLFSEYMYPTPGLEEPIINFAAYANFDDQDNIEVEVESKDGDKAVVGDGSSEVGTRALNLAVDIITTSAAAASCSFFPMDSMIPLKLLSPTTATARAMESMSLSAVASSDNDGKDHKGNECR